MDDPGYTRAKARADRVAAEALRPKVRTACARPAMLGGHVLHPKLGGGWRCSVCLHHATKWSAICSQRCEGSAADTWAKASSQLQATFGSIGKGHIRMLSGNTIWCATCGAHGSTSKVIALRKPCTGTPSANWVDKENCTHQSWPHSEPSITQRRPPPRDPPAVAARHTRTYLGTNRTGRPN